MFTLPLFFPFLSFFFSPPPRWWRFHPTPHLAAPHQPPFFSTQVRCKKPRETFPLCFFFLPFYHSVLAPIFLRFEFSLTPSSAALFIHCGSTGSPPILFFFSHELGLNSGSNTLPLFFPNFPFFFWIFSHRCSTDFFLPFPHVHASPVMKRRSFFLHLSFLPVSPCL